MVKEFGDIIRPYLKSVYDELQKHPTFAKDDKKQGKEKKHWQTDRKSKEITSKKNNPQDKPNVTAITQIGLNLNSTIEDKPKEQSCLDYVMSKPSTFWEIFSQWVTDNFHFGRENQQLLKNMAERLAGGLGISEKEAAKVKNLHERAVNNLRYKQML